MRIIRRCIINMSLQGSRSFLVSNSPNGSFIRSASIDRSQTRANSIYRDRSAEPKSSSIIVGTKALKPKYNQCFICSTNIIFSTNHSKCRSCKQSVCKLHSVRIAAKKYYRICDRCDALNTAGKEVDYYEQRRKVQQKLAYYYEDQDRREQEITLKTAMINKLRSMISNSDKASEIRERELRHKLIQEKSQNDRLEKIAANLERALLDSRENEYIIESEFTRFNSELNAIKSESDLMAAQNRELMTEADGLIDTLKHRVPIFNLQTLTCPTCFTHIMRVYKQSEMERNLDADNELSRNVSILERLSFLRQDEKNTSKGSCQNCVIM